MRDITDNMTTAAFELLKHAARNRDAWLKRFYAIGREAVRPRRAGELYGFIIEESDPARRLFNGPLWLQRILERGGVELEGTNKGLLVRMAQPYGAFAKALLEAQRYPDLRDSDGHPVAPYDVTAHTLPLLLGVKATPVYAPFRHRRANRAVTIGDSQITNPRLALYKSHVPSMDEGWTRWALENQLSMIYSSLEDAEARAGNLRAKYDTIVIPDQSPRSILDGYRKGSMPEELTGGLGKEGVKALREFVEQGGTLVTLNDASDFAIEQFDLPLRDVTLGLKRTEFYCPGSILRTILDTTHPLAKGMQPESIAWVEDSPVFEIKSDPAALARVKVIARYPDSGTPLLSGWLLGAEKIRGKAALVEVGMGKGRVYLFGFRPQYRGQSLATYPLLFNAVKGAK
jgi:hypothetical protein